MIRPRTVAGLEASSRRSPSGVAAPVVAARTYASQTSFATCPPHATDPAVPIDEGTAGDGWTAGGRPLPVEALGAGAGRDDPEPPAPKNRPAQAFLNTPEPADEGPLTRAAGVEGGAAAAAGAAANCGKRAWRRSFQVICGAIASTRRSYPASRRASAPPYEPPTTPTRGSPGPSLSTSGREARRSSSLRASATSKPGASTCTRPPLAPKPRAL